MEKTYRGVLVSEIQKTIESFDGPDELYRHAINRNVVFSQGARFVAESCGAYWLIDEIAIAQFKPKVKVEEFQAWKLKVTGGTTVLTMDDGNNHTLFVMKLPFTDFPLPEVTLWVENNTIYLPSEH